MCPSQPLAVSCPTIKANARLRRSRQWKDQSENKSPNNGNPALVTPTKAQKNTRRRRRPTRKEQLAIKHQNHSDDASTSTLSTAPSSDESACATPVKKQSKNNNNTRNKNNNTKSPQQQRRKRSKKCKPSRPTKIVNIVPDLTDEEKTNYVALDAEMVGIGPAGYTSRLARISLVNYDGETIYDTLVKVTEVVTDYRTFVSGITPQDLESDNAVSFDEAQSKVAELIQGKVVVGHGLKNDFRVLALHHPWYLIRDTAKYEPFMKTTSPEDATPLYPAGMLVPKKLKVLAKDKLGMMIQEEGKPHSPVEDAVAALELYKKHRVKWEKVMAYKVDRTKAIEQRQ